MIKVYVAGDYSADNVLDVLKNIGKGKKACADVFALGFAVFCPWHDASYVEEFCNSEMDKSMFYDNSLDWLEVSDVIYVISGIGKGGGVDMEIEHAESLGIPVVKSISELIEFGRKKK